VRRPAALLLVSVSASASALAALACGLDVAPSGEPALVDASREASPEAGDATALDAAGDAGDGGLDGGRPDAGACLGTAAGLVAWWPGEGTAADQRGENPGAAFGLVTYAPGRVGQAFSFVANGFVQVADHPSLDLTTGITVEAWVALPIVTSSTTGRILDKITVGTGDGYLLDVLNGRLRLLVGLQALTATALLPAGVFVHVAGTHDGATFRLYVDGVETASMAGNDAGVPVNDLVLRLGADNSGNTHFPGVVDEVSLYDRALAPADVAAIHAAGAFGRCR